MGRKQPGQRQVDPAHLVEIDGIIERAEAMHLVGGQRQRRIGAEVRPLLGREEMIGRRGAPVAAGLQAMRQPGSFTHHARQAGNILAAIVMNPAGSPFRSGPIGPCGLPVPA